MASNSLKPAIPLDNEAIEEFSQHQKDFINLLMNDQGFQNAETFREQLQVSVMLISQNYLGFRNIKWSISFKEFIH